MDAPALSLAVSMRELDTILAALRFWQRELPVVLDPELHDIASEHGRALDEDEIDALCTRITFAPEVIS